jgi:hypothetical protein
LGDTLYGGNCEKINRQALHCKTIYFTHPITHEKITVDSDFPKDFKGDTSEYLEEILKKILPEIKYLKLSYKPSHIRLRL